MNADLEVTRLSILLLYKSAFDGNEKVHIKNFYIVYLHGTELDIFLDVLLG